MNDRDETLVALATEPGPAAGGSRAVGSRWSRLRSGLHIAQVRLRFVAIFLLVFLIVGNWDTITSYWQRWVGVLGLPVADQAVSATTEYFCPMCPGVHSAWPAQCPVCSMPLVRRTKGEMGVLPDGSLVRMQVSPYRMQLGGIATSRVEYRELRRADGTAWADSDPFLSQPRNAPTLRKGEPRVAHVCPQHPRQVSDRPGRCPLDAAPLEPQELASHERLRWQCPVHTAVISDSARATCEQCFGLPLLPAVIAFAPEKMVLAVPQTAVVESAGLKVVFLQTSPGVFDAFPVELGAASGGYYPVIAGVARGAEIVSQGAFLLDAETRLDPDLAATYFGADVRSRTSHDPATGTTSGKSSPADVANY